MTNPDTQVVDEELRKQIDILIQQYGAKTNGKLFSSRKKEREPILDQIMQLIGQQLVKEMESLLKTRNYADVSYFTGTEYSVICERIEQITAQYNLNPKESEE